jgi:hypothetical protein
VPIPQPEKKKSAPRSAGHGKKDYTVIFARSNARKARRKAKLLERLAARRAARTA